MNHQPLFFTLFHDDKPFYIQRNKDLTEINIFAFSTRHYLWQDKKIEHTITFEKANDIWNITRVSPEFYQGIIKHLQKGSNTENIEQTFTKFVIEFLTLPNKNEYSIPRYADKKIEAVIDFIKTHPDEAEFVFDDPQWFDDYSDSLEHYCKAMLNESGRPDFISTVSHFNIDERLIAPYEKEQLKCWTFLDSHIFEGFSITTKIQEDGTPLIFAMDSEGIPSIIRDIVGIAYFIACNNQRHVDSEDDEFSRKYNKDIIDAIELYHSFMADHGIDSDPDNIYRDEHGQLILDESGSIAFPEDSDHYFLAQQEHEESPYWLYEDFCPVPL